MVFTLFSFEAAWFKRSSFLPVMMTLLPFSESNFAISNPIPALPPEIKTVLLVVFIMMNLLFYFDDYFPFCSSAFDILDGVVGLFKRKYFVYNWFNDS